MIFIHSSSLPMAGTFCCCGILIQRLLLLLLGCCIKASATNMCTPFVGTFIAGETSCLGCFTSALDCDWLGATPLLTPTLTPNDDAGCAALCLVNTRCTYYTFTSLAPGFGFCFLKNDTGALTPKTATVTENGSSCGWMFGRAAGTTPPSIAAKSSVSSPSAATEEVYYYSPSDLHELGNLQNPWMRSYVKQKKTFSLLLLSSSTRTEL